MRRIITACLCALIGVHALPQTFEKYFTDATLRIDYLFAGDAERQQVVLNGLTCLPGWAGRRHHLGELLLAGNGQIAMLDVASGACIYRNAFSSLFQEWLLTDEAHAVARGFENTFLVPMPAEPAEVIVTLFTPRRDTAAVLRHLVRPDDILIHRPVPHASPHRYLLQNGSATTCIDVAILAEGYREDEMDLFYHDAARAADAIFSYEPLASLKGRFNVVAVASPSADSGVSVPREGVWLRTAFGSHFDTFYSARYLTTSRVSAVHNALQGIAYEHIVILANTEVYGGGGIYNAFTLTTAHHSQFRPVVAHEFGHSFAGLADEYFHPNDVMSDTYPVDVEPWEPNITTLVNFASKWKDTDAPLFEGGGYASRGIYRPADDCRMRTNSCPVFCEVCQRAIRRMVDFYTVP